MATLEAPERPESEHDSADLERKAHLSRAQEQVIWAEASAADSDPTLGFELMRTSLELAGGQLSDLKFKDYREVTEKRLKELKQQGCKTAAAKELAWARANADVLDVQPSLKRMAHLLSRGGLRLQDIESSEEEVRGFEEKMKKPQLSENAMTILEYFWQRQYENQPVVPITQIWIKFGSAAFDEARETLIKNGWIEVTKKEDSVEHFALTENGKTLAEQVVIYKGNTAELARDPEAANTAALKEFRDKALQALRYAATR